jgi:glycogen debranching enzyme
VGGGAASGVQPSFQGFALDALIRWAGDDFLTTEECARMYPKFEKWTEFWLKYKNAGRGDDVTAINSPHDSGWDDASIFKDGFPTQNPDVIAFLIDMMYMTARLAKGCGKTAEADSWNARADRLLDTLVREFWDGEKFVTFANGKPVDSMSLACYQPIMLGDRLPQEIVDKIAERLTEDGDFLCEIGLCTESLKSPLCDYSANTFVSGRVVAPPHLILTAGLNLAGKKKEAAKIARRWCDNVNKNGIILGFAPYEYYKLTGKKADITYGPVASDGWCWSPWAAGPTMAMITHIIPEADALDE